MHRLVLQILVVVNNVTQGFPKLTQSFSKKFELIKLLEFGSLIAK
jgi:hypothetical protein